MKLRQQLTLALIIPSIGIVIILAVFSFLQVRSFLIDSIVENEVAVVEELAQHVDEHLFAYHESILKLSQDNIIQDILLEIDSAENINTLRQFEISFNWDKLTVIDAENPHLIYEEYLKDLDSKEVYYTDLIPSPTSHKETIIFIAPIYLKNSTETPSAYILGESNWNKIIQTLESYPNDIFIINENSEIIEENTHSQQDSNFIKTSQVQELISLEGGSIYNNQDVISLAALNGHKAFHGNNWELITRRNISDVFLTARSAAAYISIFTTLIILPFALMIFLFVYRLVINPIKKMTKTIANIGGEGYDKRIATQFSHELNDFGREINKMVAKMLSIQAERNQLNIMLKSAVNEKTRKLNMEVQHLQDAKSAFKNLLEDSTEVRKDLEKSLEEKLKFSGALVHSFDAISLWQIDDKGSSKIIYINPAWEKLFGFKNDEVINKMEPLIFLNNDIQDKDLIKKLNKSTKNDDVFVGDVKLRTKDGEILIVETVVSPIRNNKGEVQFWTSVLRNITKRKENEDKISELNELKSEFIRVVSHQLRTPLTVIRWNLELILENKLGEIGEDQKKFIRNTYDANIMVIDIINDIMTALDIEEGRTIIKKDQASIQYIWDSVLKDLEEVAKLKEIKVIDTPSTELIPLSSIDSDKIRAVFQKLADNAYYYSNNNGEIKTKLSLKDNKIRFEIKDNGIGIPKMDIARVFQRFFRGTNANSKKTDASGLGLFIAKSYIDLHNGTIGCDSTEGEGSSFWFEMPIE